jgi:hypothetical protein
VRFVGQATFQPSRIVLPMPSFDDPSKVFAAFFGVELNLIFLSLNCFYVRKQLQVAGACAYRPLNLVHSDRILVTRGVPTYVRTALLRP